MCLWGVGDGGGGQSHGNRNHESRSNRASHCIYVRPWRRRLRPLVAYFADVGAIHQQHQFAPFREPVFRSDTINQPVAPFDASRILSVVSDNVFVATIFIAQVREAIVVGAIGSSRNGAALLELGLHTIHVCHQLNRPLPLAAPHFIVAVSGLAAGTCTGSDRAAENLACLGALTGGRLRMGVERNQASRLPKPPSFGRLVSAPWTHDALPPCDQACNFYCLSVS